MLIIVDRDRNRDPDTIERRQPRPTTPAPLTQGVVGKLWVWASAMTLLTSGVAMARLSGYDFSLGLGGSRDGSVATLEPSLPYGKGMWIWQPEKSDGGDIEAMINRAKAVGLSHIFVRTGSSWDGFYAAAFLDKIVPAAHKAKIRVYGWDFPRLIDPADDVQRALYAINHQAPGGHTIDGFAPDIETWSEGTHITAEAAAAYGEQLRASVGAGYPLIACVPRPSDYTKRIYPYTEVIAQFDAVAPMVYWLNRQPDTDMAGALVDLVPFGKPIFPIGQAFDGGPEGGRWGMPPPDELQRFMRVAHEGGVHGVSFWSWQAADQTMWDAIRDGPTFSKPKSFQAG
ncbi:MAG: hypothetical protein ACRD12_12575 [Acidimicrobiales bacterium]